MLKPDEIGSILKAADGLDHVMIATAVGTGQVDSLSYIFRSKLLTSLLHRQINSKGRGCPGGKGRQRPQEFGLPGGRLDCASALRSLFRIP